VLIAEYLCELEQLTQKTVELIVALLKIQGGDGSPVRCFAIEDD
jgi:kynurenine formamidase